MPEDSNHNNENILDTSLEDFLGGTLDDFADINEPTISSKIAEYDNSDILDDDLNRTINKTFNNDTASQAKQKSTSDAADILSKLTQRHQNVDLSQPNKPKPSTPDLNSVSINPEDLLSFEDDEEDLEKLGTMDMNMENQQSEDLSSLISEEEVEESDDEQVKFKDLTKNILIAVVAIIIVSSLAFAVHSKKGSNASSGDNTVETNEQDPNATIESPSINNQLNVGLYNAESLVVDKTTQTDYLILTKHLVTWDDSIYAVISGTTTKNKVPVKIFVQPEIYNSVTDGQVITVYYNDVVFNEQHYSTNFALGEVVGE
jgi:hypothetical protein